MSRREFVTLLGTAAAWPLATGAAPAAMPVVGVLDTAGIAVVAAFRAGLAEAGHVEGRNVTIELRTTDRNERLPAFAAELVRRRVDVIAALGGLSARAAKAATATIPIVFSIGGDPVEVGLVGSLNRPGGNITGTTFFAAHLLQKQVELLRELAPGAAVLGALVNPDNPRAPADIASIREAARALGLETHIVNAAVERDLAPAFAELVGRHAAALLIVGDAFFHRARSTLAQQAAGHAIPAIFWSRDYAEAGGFVSYGASVSDSYREAGAYVGRILKGEKPGDLPVLQPTKFELVINLKTARALGIEVPPTLLARADEVIE
jgi:putative ABC transport system substrate-binding protein